MQNMPFHRSTYLAPLMAITIESFDLSAYDLVISSSVFFSKGIIVRPRTKHICYCYSPTRQLWDRHKEAHQGLFSTIGKHALRVWDRVAADRVDEFIAVSEYAQKRIKKYYHRDSHVIYPPMSLVPAQPHPREDFYLLVARLYPHKNIDIAIDAFNKLGYTLRIVGTGPRERELKAQAGPNIEFLGYVANGELAKQYCKARALIMPQEEDFGLTPVESLTHGTPVIALRKGGAVEILHEGETGEFFDDPIPEGLADAVRRFNEKYDQYDRRKIMEYAERFSGEHFRTQINEVVTRYDQLQWNP